MNDGSGIYIILILAFLALTLVGTWKVFEKAGYAGFGKAGKKYGWAAMLF